MAIQIPSSNNFAKNQPGLLVGGQVIPIQYIDTNGASNGDLLTFVSSSGQIEFLPGGGGAGITQLTGDVTAGPGSGSQAATIANGAVTAVKLGATFPFAGTPDTISPTAALAAAPVFSGTPDTISPTAALAAAPVFSGTPDTISPTAALAAAPTFTGAALGTHTHDLQQDTGESLTVTAGTGVSSAAVNAPIANVESVYVTAGGVTGVFTLVPGGITPTASREVGYNPTTGVFQFLIADAITAATIQYLQRDVTAVSAGTPAGTNDAPAITVTGAAYTPAGTNDAPAINVTGAAYTPAGTNDAPAITVTGAAYTPAGTITPA